MASVKTGRIGIRVSPEHDEVIRLAAERRSESVSDYVIGSALERAERDMADRRIVQLNESDWEAFTDALESPPRVNERLARTIEKAQDASGM